MPLNASKLVFEHEMFNQFAFGTDKEKTAHSSSDKDDGTGVLGLGDNYVGQNKPCATPKIVDMFNNDNLFQISTCGSNSALAIDINGNVYGWGKNDKGMAIYV